MISRFSFFSRGRSQAAARPRRRQLELACAGGADRFTAAPAAAPPPLPPPAPRLLQPPRPRRSLRRQPRRPGAAGGAGRRAVASASAALLAGLNDEQREVVQRGDGLVAVQAGPGSGKTRVIVARVLHLLQKKGAHPKAVLALTFSKKAAAEMAERLKAAAGGNGGGGGGGSSSLPTVQTFHAFCASLLRSHGSAVGVTPGFRIAGEAEQLRVVGELLRDGAAAAAWNDGIGSWPRKAPPPAARPTRRPHSRVSSPRSARAAWAVAAAAVRRGGSSPPILRRCARPDASTMTICCSTR